MSTKPDYTKLDRLILERITSSSGITSAQMLQGSIGGECDRLAAECIYHKNASRFLEGRLQALRKRGLIRFTPSTGWAAVRKGGAA